ncbi:PilZ domain-containing protein [Sphingomonas pituitosa]|uniref:PilZ domain-containing protein n=1 Tax=Sphingomonas pituitosa TaxID=99597 RepID=UPI000831C179|nr:PilZ domain-containing protein [Sphingomonas pituitosa]
MGAAEHQFDHNSSDPGPWAERAPRTVTTLMVGKLICAGAGEQLCRVRNISATGMMLESPFPLREADGIVVELRGGPVLEGRIMWVSAGRAGVQFPAPIDVEEVLATAKGSSPAARLRRAVPRAPRFQLGSNARLVCNGVSHTVVMENISQSGARIRLSNQPDLDRVMTLVIPGLNPRSCTVRWIESDSAGVAFIDMIPYAELAAWLTEVQAPR